MERSRRRYRHDTRPLDLYRGLGPGDPGYRLRSGRSGLDPVEQSLEQGRVYGVLLRNGLEGWSGKLLVVLMLTALIAAIFAIKWITLFFTLMTVAFLRGGWGMVAPAIRDAMRHRPMRYPRRRRQNARR